MTIVEEFVALLGFDIEGEANAKRFKQTLADLDSGLDQLGRSATKYAAIAGAAIVAGLGASAKSVISTSAEFEGFQAALETIEGSSEKAKESLDWISEFGKTTPYEVAGVTDAFIKLKAYGIDPVADDALRTLGDTASAMNKPLEQAVEAFADAATGEFERLKEFGIRAKQQGEEVTFSWTRNGQALSKTVGKNSDEIRRFLLENMGDRFNGAMLRQSKTWSGMMSNLGDSWTDFQRRIGAAGFFDTVKSYLGGVLDWVGRLDADGTLDKWAKNLSDIFTSVAEGVRIFADRVKTHVGFIVENFDELKPIITGVTIAFGLLIAKANPIATAIFLIALAVEDLLTYLEGGESIIGGFIDGFTNNDWELTGKVAIQMLVDGIKGVLWALYDFNIWFWGNVADYFSNLPWESWGKSAMLWLQAGIVSVLSKIKDYFVDKFEAVMKYLGSLKDRLSQLGSNMMQSLYDGITAVGDQIKGYLAGLLPQWALDMLSGETKIDLSSVAMNTDYYAATENDDGTYNVSGTSVPSDMRDRPVSASEFNRLVNTLERMKGVSLRSGTVPELANQTTNNQVTNNVQVTQNISNPVNAPKQAASAVATATTNAAGRSSIHTEPGMR